MEDTNFQTIFESAPGLYLVLDRDFKIVAVTEAYLDTTMTRREEILGKGIFEVFPDHPNDAHATGVKNLRKSLLYVLQKKIVHTLPELKHDIRDPEGNYEERFWHVLNKPILGKENEVQYILHCVEDISDRIKAETKIKAINEVMEEKRNYQLDQLKKSQSLFSNIFNHNPASIAISRLADARIMNVNSSFLKTFGFSSREDVIGKTGMELNIFVDPGQRGEMLRLLKENKKVESLEGKAHGPNGEVRWISTSIHPIELDDTPCLLAVSLDITKRKQQEELLRLQAEHLTQMNKELETFSYSVSHDLKAPLRALEGFSYALLEAYKGKFDENADRWLNFIAKNANKMGVLINDILSFSKVSRSDLSTVRIDMQQLIQQVFDDEKGSYTSKKINFVLENMPDAYGDFPMLKQVWHNLISNALKYSSKNDNISICIQGKTVGDFNIFSITDNGVGFDDKYKDKLFGVFQRLHTDAQFEGTGVGLAIVNRIIQKHKGWIEVHSQVGKGTEFIFAIPR